MANITDVYYIGPCDRIMGNIVIVPLAALCLSPLPTMCTIWKKKSTEEFHPYPYMAALLNCFAWLLYCVPAKPLPIPFRFHSLYSSNLAWVYFVLFYCAIFWIYTTTRNRKILASIFPITLLLFCTTLYIWKSWYDTSSDRMHLTTKVRHCLTGPIGVVTGIIMYGSPLTIMKNVYETNSVDYLPYWPCLAYSLNGLVWFIYACLPPAFDPFIAITNGVGALLGLLQLGVYYKFHVRSEESSAISLKG